jgi:hypothetical protein
MPNPSLLDYRKVHRQKYAIVVRHIVDGVDAGRIVRDEDARFKMKLPVWVHALKRIKDNVSNKMVEAFFVLGHVRLSTIAKRWGSYRSVAIPLRANANSPSSRVKHW